MGELIMQAYEFSSEIEERGIIQIPERYLQNIASPVRIILLTNEKAPAVGEKCFSAMKLKRKGFKFDRDAANER